MESTIRKKFYFPSWARLGRFKDPFFNSWWHEYKKNPTFFMCILSFVTCCQLHKAHTPNPTHAHGYKYMYISYIIIITTKAIPIPFYFLLCNDNKRKECFLSVSFQTSPISYNRFTVEVIQVFFSLPISPLLLLLHLIFPLTPSRKPAQTHARTQTILWWFLLDTRWNEASRLKFNSSDQKKTPMWISITINGREKLYSYPYLLFFCMYVRSLNRLMALPCFF